MHKCNSPSVLREWAAYAAK